MHPSFKVVGGLRFLVCACWGPQLQQTNFCIIFQYGQLPIYEPCHLLFSFKHKVLNISCPFKKIHYLLMRRSCFSFVYDKCNESYRPNANLLSNSTHHWRKGRVDSQTCTHAITFFFFFTSIMHVMDDLEFSLNFICAIFDAFVSNVREWIHGEGQMG